MPAAPPPLAQAARVANWLHGRALPLWARAGIDPSGAGAWEALDHDARPLTARDKRLRVMPRQAFVFARAAQDGAGQGAADYLGLAQDLFGFAMRHGFDPNTGHLAARLAPDGTLLQAPHDLYDLAFMYLAAAALAGAGAEIGDTLDRLDRGLDRLAAPRGWHETADARLPRRQNPHMHLFEAATELYAVTAEPRYARIAETCLELFREVFLQPDGRVFEFFNADWGPPQGAQAVEPGHMAEWIWLLDRHAAVTGTDPGVDLGALFAQVLAGRDGMGLLRDSTVPLAETRRLWPQTELLKAALVLRRRGLALPEDAGPDRILDRLFAEYLDTPVPGGWYDKRHLDGRLLSTDMPSSTFYHLYVAFAAYLQDAGAVTT
ncbi:MAG: AGE family epimerase/isomerase [Rhodobacter sp.]|nr:AGE family epimerase/isomerase [Rhodobacter sp.]